MFLGPSFHLDAYDRVYTVLLGGRADPRSSIICDVLGTRAPWTVPSTVELSRKPMVSMFSGGVKDQNPSAAWCSFLYQPVEKASLAIFKIGTGRYRDRDLKSRELFCINCQCMQSCHCYTMDECVSTILWSLAKRAHGATNHVLNVFHTRSFQRVHELNLLGLIQTSSKLRQVLSPEAWVSHHVLRRLLSGISWSIEW